MTKIDQQPKSYRKHFL